MSEIKTHHIALQRGDRERAIVFFTKLLGYKLVKTSRLPVHLSREIFDIEDEPEVLFFTNEEDTSFEVFITKHGVTQDFSHVCLVVPDLELFCRRCRDLGLRPFFVEKNGKQLVFVRDEDGNLFEIKQS
ncbi:MAG TPA: VOC family protein [Thermoplasmatales archaeon]|nr:VOC family protein [Thermoplasmatales archaeon]